MMTLIVGQPGAGKSLKMVKDHIIKEGAGQRGIPKKLNLGGADPVAPRYVLTNIPLNLEKINADFPSTKGYLIVVNEFKGDPNFWSDPEKIQELANEFLNKDGKGPLFVIDEAHLFFSKRKLTEEARDWFTLHRHSGVDIILATQQQNQLDRDMVGLCELYIILRRKRLSGFGARKYIEIVKEGAKGSELSRILKDHDTRFYPYYQSHYTGTIKESEPKAKPIWMRWQVLAAGVAAPVALVVAIFFFAPAFMKMMTGGTVREVQEKQRLASSAQSPPAIVSVPNPVQPVEAPMPLPQPEPVGGNLLSPVTDGFSNNMDAIRSGLEDVGALVAAPIPGDVVDIVRKWEVRSWAAFFRDGEWHCSARFLINGQSTHISIVKRDLDWKSLTYDYDPETKECVLTIDDGTDEGILLSNIE